MDSLSERFPDTAARWVRLTQHPWFARAVTVAVLSGLYVLGIVHWTWFFNRGQLSFAPYDWPKEAMYLELLKQALTEGRIPYHFEVPADYARAFAHTKHGRFLGLPETVLSPQIVLLPFVTVGRFVLFHNLLLYSLGFVGSLLFKRRYRLSLLPFAVFVVLFNFNGYITAHLGVGHSMWSGYFLLPFFGLFILEWVERGTLTPALKLALVLFGILLQGSFHMVIWCWLFVFLVVLFNWRLWKGGLLLFGFSGLLSAFRLIPAAIAMWGFPPDYSFIGGHRTLTDLLEAFLVIRDSTYRWIGGVYNIMGWWEYDIYVGLLGFIALVYFGIYRRFDRDPDLAPYRYASLDMPLVILSLLSMNYYYVPIYQLPIPLVNTERVTARFLIIPVVLVMMIAALRMERVLPKWKLPLMGMLLVAGGIVETFFSLVTHSHAWRILAVEQADGSNWHHMETSTLIDRVDPVYVLGVWLSAVLSLLALVAWGYVYVRVSVRQDSHPVWPTRKGEGNREPQE